MKHYVFTAGKLPINQSKIEAALKVTEILRDYWNMNATVTGVYEGSKITINHNDGNNISICMEDDNLHRLIRSCMRFARELQIKISSKVTKT